MTEQLSATKQALLAQRLRGRGTAPSVPVRPAGAPLPMSFAQERLWFMDQFQPGATAYTIPFTVRLRGPLDAGRLAAALEALPARHQALRTLFRATGDGRPEPFLGDAALPLTRADAEGEPAARALVDAFYAEPFDLAAGPLARALLVRLGAAHHVLAVAVHHIAADGWSIDVLRHELFTLYEGGTLPEPPVQYGDFALWQRERAESGRSLAHWAQRLAGAEPLRLPTDRPRPAEQTHSGAEHVFRVDAELTARLSALADDHGATLYMTLLTALSVVLSRCSGQDDIVIGSPVAGRDAPELEGLIGCFVNLLAMRADLSGDPSFSELLLRLRETALDAYAHQDLPFEHLVAELNVARDVSRSPVFQVLLAVQNYGTGPTIQPDGLGVEPFGLGRWVTRFDLELYCGTDDDGLGCQLLYNTDLFDAATIERLAGWLVTLLRATTEHPFVPLSGLDLRGPEERAARWNDTEAPFDDTPVHLRFERQARRTPDAPALLFEGRETTYAELNAAANRIAHVLRRHGAGPGTLVGVCAERSVELVAALLGVLKSGAAYVPFDPDYPDDRLAFMAADAAAPLILTLGDCAWTGSTRLRLDDPEVWAAAPTDDPDPAAAEIAYMIYTSGSTGRPKGVPNTHRGLANRLHWMQERFGLGPDDTVLQKTPAGFDVSVWEFFWPLLHGARIALARPGGHKDAAYLRDLIDSAEVTTVHFVPSMLAVFLAEAGPGACPTLRRIICSGEELPVELARRCLAALPGELHNLYGPTEAAIDVSAWRCTPENLAGLARVPIGTPMANTTLHVLGPAMNSLPVGCVGELHIGGVQVAAGYHGRPELTAERFVSDPSRGRLYRTGDLARRRPDGALEFLGRIDGQVKLRGLRIELGEIEAVLRERPGVTDAAVVVREDRPGDQRLVAYVVGAPPDRALLKRTLPDYMVPSAIVPLDALPLSPSGKLDRAALPAPVAGRDESTAFIAPSTPSQKTVAGIWSVVLDVERIGIDDDFFDLGGHSMLATQVVARLRRALPDAAVSVMDVFTFPTVRELADLIDTPAAARGPRGLLYELTPRRTSAPARSFVCVPYGGGSAVVYQPLADALPNSNALWSVAIPGHDLGINEDRLPFEELVERCTAEILEKVPGPIILYGHCGVGSALTTAIALRLEAAGAELECVYIGAIFPFARPRSRIMSAASRLVRMESARSDQGYVNWLTSLGLDMGELDPDEARRIVRNMRRDSEAAEEYFTELFESGTARLSAPLVTVAGERDPATDYYQERYREWHFLTGESRVVLLAEAGHFFLKYRADELAEIVTSAHREDELERPGWRLHAVSRSTDPVTPAGPQPSMRRFMTVAAGQLVSIIGSALTEFAVPLWVLTTTHSVANFALFAVLGLLPGMLVAPLAGAVVDRFDRRRVMLAGDLAAGGVQLMLGLLVWTGRLQLWQLYPLLVCLSVALTFQRLAYGSAVPQLVPKRNLGHANGVVQLISGTAQLLVPLVAVGLMAGIGLGGILVLDVVSYAFASAVTLLVRFPATMPWKRRESIGAEIRAGFAYSWNQRGLRAMLLFFAVFNIFLSPLTLMISPLVLARGSLGDAGTISFCSGVGAFAGGIVMVVWGGPRHRRLRGVMLTALALAASCLVIGLRPSLWVIGAGAVGLAFWLTVMNSIYTTIIQVKVPQRFHGRVFALNTVIAWSTLPIGFGLIAPNASAVFGPLLEPHGALAGTVGAVLGTGPGRGIGLMYLLFALAMATVVAGALRTRLLSRFDDEVPDAEADDLIGLRALKEHA